MAQGEDIEKLEHWEWRDWKSAAGTLWGTRVRKAQKLERNSGLLTESKYFSSRCLVIEEPTFKNMSESESQYQFGIAYNPQRESKDALFFKKMSMIL